MDWTNSYDPTCFKDRELEPEYCAYDGKAYHYCETERVYNPSLGEWESVAKKNLKEYKLKNNING